MEQHITAEEPYYTSTSIQRELLPSSLARSPPGRSSTLPPGRTLKPNRPRKSSVGQNARKPKHERPKSREHHRRPSYDRKAFSAEPQTAAAILGKRWEDLIDAAASATEEDSRDLTPVSTKHPSALPKLTLIGTPIASLHSSHDKQPHVVTALYCFSVPVVHRIAVAKYIDPSAARHARAAALPVSRVIY